MTTIGAAEPVAFDDDQAPEVPRDRVFDPWRITRTHSARRLVVEVLQRIEDHELRGKARSNEARRKFARMVEAVICDLACHHLASEPGAITITRSREKLAKRSPYLPPEFNDRLPRILDMLGALDYLVQHKGERMSHEKVWCEDAMAMRPRRMTTIEPGHELAALLAQHGIELEDFGRDENEQTILLKDFKPEPSWYDPKPKAPLFPYSDTRAIERMRAEMWTINQQLAALNLRLAGALPDKWKHVDIDNRRLARHFTRRSFRSGGLLFGGWWLNFPKRLRSLIRINDEPVVACDYRAMFVHLAYAHVGAEPPPGDPYAVPGFERYRDGIKKVLTASLFRKSPMQRVPKRTRPLLPDGVRVEEIIAAIKRQHGAIAHLIETMVGHRLMFVESNLLVKLLLKLQAAGIGALPLHDALIIPRSSIDQTISVMSHAAEEEEGIRIPVHSEIDQAIEIDVDDIIEDQVI